MNIRSQSLQYLNICDKAAFYANIFAKVSDDCSKLSENLDAFWRWINSGIGMGCTAVSLPVHIQKKLIQSFSFNIAYQAAVFVRSLLILCDHRYLDLIPQISEALARRADGLRRVSIVSARAFNESERKHISQRIKESLAYPVLFSFEVDSSILGGFAVFSKNWMYDATMLSIVNRLRKEMSI